MNAHWIVWRSFSGADTRGGTGRDVIEQASLSDGLTKSIVIDDSFRAVTITFRNSPLPIVFPFDRVLQATIDRP